MKNVKQKISNREKIKSILDWCYEFGPNKQISSGVGDDGITRYTCTFNETRALDMLEKIMAEKPTYRKRPVPLYKTLTHQRMTLYKLRWAILLMWVWSGGSVKQRPTLKKLSEVCEISGTRIRQAIYWGERVKKRMLEKEVQND
jgi:hypothetical protein